MSYFRYFPKIVYNDVNSFNITARSKILEDIIKKYSVFYLYTVNQDERPDQVAKKYYESEQYTWLVFLSNTIYDPYFQWVLNDFELNELIKSKYNISPEQALNEILHYEYEGLETDIVGNFDVSETERERVNYTMSIRTYNTYKFLEENYPNVDRPLTSAWKPVTVYEYEDRENEKRRNIYLLSRQYLSKIESDLRRAFS